LKELGDNAPNPEELILSDVGKKGYEKLEKESLLEGRKILEYLNSFGKPVFIVPGNWDQSFGETTVENPDKNNYSYYKSWFDKFLGNKTNPFLTKGLRNIYDCQYNLFKRFNVNLLGYGLSNNQERITKNSTKKLSKDEIRKLDKIYFKIMNKLDNLHKKRNRKHLTIFISHNVPYNTKLDIIKDKKSYAYKKHLGSYVARRFCKKYQPLLCIGGHIHEHFGKTKIGKTIVINAGFGKDANVLIDLDEKKGKIRKIEFYKGYKPVK